MKTPPTLDCFEELLSPSTHRAYQQDLRYFWTWAKVVKGCKRPRYPTPPSWVIQYIREQVAGLDSKTVRNLRREGLVLSGEPISVLTIQRRVTALSLEHKKRGLTSLRDHTAIALGLRRLQGLGPKRVRKLRPITGVELKQLLAVCSSDLRGLRDRAILLVGFFSGGRRRSELSALAVEDLSPIPSGYLVALPKHKTARYTRTPLVFPIKGMAAQALDRWLKAAKISSGPIFRGVDCHDNVLPALQGRAVSRIIKRLASTAGLDPALYSAHGLRTGFITESLNSGIALVDVMQLTGHRDGATAFGYFQPKATMMSRVPEVLELKMKRSSRGMQLLKERAPYAGNQSLVHAEVRDLPTIYVRRGQFMHPLHWSPKRS